MKLYYNLALTRDMFCVAYVGDFDVPLLGGTESTVKYHTELILFLTHAKRGDSVWRVVYLGRMPPKE